MGCGFSVLAAARAARAGGSLEEVARAARAVAARTDMYATLDTLSYVARSGRVPKVARFAAARVHVFPLLRIGSGRARPVRLYRTRSRAIEGMMDIAVRAGTSRPIHAAVLHAGAYAEAIELLHQLEESCDCNELLITEFTPVMGAHTGIGLVGIAFYPVEGEA